MADNSLYISAGLPASRTASEDPTANVNTLYVAAGLWPANYDDEGAPPAGGGRPSPLLGIGKKKK